MSLVNNLQKRYLARSKVDCIKKCFFIAVIFCTSVTILYFFRNQILYNVSKGYSTFITNISNILINNGFVIDKVIISGNASINKSDILQFVDRKCAIIFLSINDMRDRIKSSNAWIKDVVIKRVLPNTIYIEVQEYYAFANWIHNGINSIIDNTGHVIVNTSNRANNLISIYGDNALHNLYFIREVLSDNSMLSAMISSFIWVGDRRWDIIFSSGLEVRLPESDPHIAWNYLAYLNRTSNEFITWKVVDMRVTGKIFIQQ
ncbi:FtsQ-type POTRA domain-containing protein [Neoehrlichia mikurensis]|uniref:FtsQ-type POTRA domain-containing protein n=1 Tax=Neoehrlichia mikurensis TaxID=89586 RepID=A0A9Q9BVI2_9RICK|nr:cell division protein FtsQ/DivIB [Neoehrlichia mikurensis]QXK91743.1 FtsQ-type POTRA domain-containing protein [Neoehrlichia mikurensis]QXK92955.1 FtsQ-type POTRA domain-containing protein [Neoehrlichia mikurensis]QXK93433.1 FtsQ-type POTRA domain-containing protein [Neoehrlichia mikurensis]UTO55613.1 FtsQ-type POTRA domain-containing protein [Neoehrlichia mikurensis]UTO56534.1 FtsQ-type POTRA domain-containing protein [Neoehrlichia mikurensis]